MEPGAVATEFVSNVGAAPGSAAAGPYTDALGAYLGRAGEAFAAAQAAAGVADTVLRP